MDKRHRSPDLDQRKICRAQRLEPLIFQTEEKARYNTPEMWVRADDVFEPIVDRQLFDGAQALIGERSYKMPDEEMLSALGTLLQQQGYLCGIIIDETDGLPSSSAYRSRFGSLLRAYELVGYTPDHDYGYIEINRSLRALHPGIVASAIAGIEKAGGKISQGTDGLLRLNDEFTVSIVIARCNETLIGSARWQIRLDTSLFARYHGRCPHGPFQHADSRLLPVATPRHDCQPLAFGGSQRRFSRLLPV